MRWSSPWDGGQHDRRRAVRPEQGWPPGTQSKIGREEARQAEGRPRSGAQRNVQIVSMHSVSCVVVAVGRHDHCEGTARFLGREADLAEDPPHILRRQEVWIGARIEERTHIRHGPIPRDSAKPVPYHLPPVPFGQRAAGPACLRQRVVQ